MRHLDIVITGKVQGVFFRDTARQVATRLGLAGFARNEADGSVRIEVEGEERELQKFLEWCHVGPERAAVTDVAYAESPTTNASDFSIL